MTLALPSSACALGCMAVGDAVVAGVRWKACHAPRRLPAWPSGSGWAVPIRSL